MKQFGYYFYYDDYKKKNYHSEYLRSERGRTFNKYNFNFIVLGNYKVYLVNSHISYLWYYYIIYIYV